MDKIMDISDLIKELEEAKEGSAELSKGVFQVIMPGINTKVWDNCPVPYTTSVDAAASLIPDDCYWMIYREKDSRYCEAEVDDWYAEAKTAPLALCLAWLEAFRKGGELEAKYAEEAALRARKEVE